MATVKQRLNRYNGSSYDTVHLETESSVVLRSDGTTVEEALSGMAKETTSQSILTNTNTIIKTLSDMHTKRYGYRVKISEGSPTGRVEYLHDAVGMTPAYMNFGSAFSYGSWGDVWFVRDNFPCMVTYDGIVDYRLKLTDYSQRANGSASDITNATYTGNAMSALPCVWYTRYTEGGYYYFICSEQQYDTSFWADVHTKSDGSIGNYDFDAIYKGSYITTDSKVRLRSLSGQRPGNSQNATTELGYATNCGNNWTLKKWNRWSLIGDLLTLMSKSCNSQAAFGQGHTTGGSSAASLLDTGTLNTAGGFFGYSDTTHAVKVFHQENPWGDRWDRCMGLICNNGQALARMNQVGGTYNFTGAGYTPVGINIADGGYQVKVHSNRYGNLPETVGGSETTYETDYFWINKAIVAVAIVGGHCGDGSSCGCRCVHLFITAGRSHWYFGASPSLAEPM